MAVFVPFRALRAHRKFIEKVAAHPYDVVEWDEAAGIGEKNAYSFLHVEKPEIDFPRDIPPGDPRVPIGAKNYLRRLADQGVLFQEEKPCFYVYSQQQSSRVQYGIVGCLSVSEYESGVIKKHELTTVDKEQERIRNIDTVNANTGLVFCLYTAQETIDRLVREISEGKPEYDFTFENGVAHRVWVVRDDLRITSIRNAFRGVPSIYIADGHHRAAAAAAVARMRKEKSGTREAESEDHFFMAGVFPHYQVKIIDYNRAVRDLNGLSEEEFITKVKERFLVEPDFSEKTPSAAREFGMYLQGRWFKLQIAEKEIIDRDLVERLDVSILQDFLLAPILSILDPRTDQRIKFIGGARGMPGLEEAVNSGQFAVAFSLYPPAVQQLMAVADAGRTMPPKSTWFEPKLLSGIFVHLLE
jgi:uncharacterized protein (DUF1015 family)